MLNYINGRNKVAAAKILNLPLEAISEVVEYNNSYYIKVKKGFGRSGTFISKIKLLTAKSEMNLVRWMQDFKKRGVHVIQVGTETLGRVKDFGVLNFTNLELALYEYRKGLKTSENDRVVIGSFDKWKNYREVDSYRPKYS